MAEDFRELEEQAEEAAQHNLAPVTVTMAILAVLVAAVSLLGHRAHTEEMLTRRERPIIGPTTRRKKSAAAITSFLWMRCPCSRFRNREQASTN